MILLAKVVIELFYHCVVETKRETRLCFIQGRGHIVWKDQQSISFELGNVLIFVNVFFILWWAVYGR